MTNCFRHLREYPELRAEIKKGAKELMESIPELTLEEAYLRQASMLLNESITDRDTVNQSVYDLYVKTAAGKKAVKNESKKQNKQTKVSAGSYKDNSLEDSATNEVKTLATEPEKQAVSVKKSRFEYGKKISKDERKKILSTLKDVYKEKGADKELRINNNGDEYWAYPYQPELFEKSDVTGQMIRYYVTLPDETIAHPTELFPNVTKARIDSIFAEQNHQEEIVRRETSRILEHQFNSIQDGAIFWNEQSAIKKGIPNVFDRDVYYKGDKYILPYMGLLNGNPKIKDELIKIGWKKKTYDLDDEQVKNVTKNEATKDNESVSLASKQKTKNKATGEVAEKDKQELETYFERHESVLDKAIAGGINANDYKASFNEILNNEQAIKDELSKLTKKELLNRLGGMAADRVKNEKKDRIIESLYSDMLSSYILPDKNGWISHSYSFGDKKHQGVIDKVEAITDEQLETYAKQVAERKKQNEEEQKEIEKGLDNPKTLDDYQRIMYQRVRVDGMTYQEGRMTLTPEQREQFDLLSGDESRKKRDYVKERDKNYVATNRAETDAEIIKTQHTRDGYDLWVVQAADRVEKDIYRDWLSAAKKLGGWYSRYRGNGATPGFQFKTEESAKAFQSYVSKGDTEAVKEQAQERRDAFKDDKTQSTVERLNEMAERLENKANDSLSRDRLENTARRARMAASAEADANNNLALAGTMRNIADAISKGTALFLDRVRQKTQVEMLRSFVSQGHYKQVSEEFKGKNNYVKEEAERNKAPTIVVADYVEYPSFRAYRSDLARLARQMLDQEGAKKLGKKLLSVADDVTDAYLKFAEDNLIQVATFAGKDGTRATFKTKKAANESIAFSGFNGTAIPFQVKRGEHLIILSPAEAMKRGIWEGDDKLIKISPDLGNEIQSLAKDAKRSNLSIPYQFESAAKNIKRLREMGLHTPAELRAAVREFIKLSEVPKEADKVKKLEREMVGRVKDGLDFFPTPGAIVKQMIDIADIQDGMSVLEPSAGMGHIAEGIRENGIEPDVIEFSAGRRELLEAKGFNVVDKDFMEHSSNEGYDRIIMNPPFSNRRDAEHVKHAYDLLKPGGRLVAIMGEGVFFGSDKKAQAFNEWLESVGGISEKLPDGTFNDKSLPVTTGVNTRLVVIDKSSDVKYSKSRKTTGSTVEQVISWLPKRIQRKVSSVVEVVQSVDELPTHLQERGTALYHAAFHGSPHDFDKFSTENIGTGEGAQAYGWGMYFAGSKEVAEWYRDKLTGEPIKVINISKEDASTIINEIIKLKISDTTKKELNSRLLNSELELIKNKAIQSETISDLENLIYTIEEYVIGSGYYSAETNLLAQKILDIANPFINREVINNGKIYHVELAPKENEYLLWDKPLSEQSEKVKRSLNIDINGDFELYRDLLIDKYGTRRFHNQLTKAEKTKLDHLRENRSDDNVSGESLYKNLTTEYSSAKTASEYLHSLGIRGIKYLDGSSRGKGEGNYNYVIFDDNDIAIKAKYSKALQGVEGLYDKQTDKTYLIADMLNKDNVLAVAQHELLHRALATDTKLKNQLANLNRRLQVQFNRAAKGKASEIENKAYKRVIDAETPVANQLEEFGAYLVSEYNNKPDSLTGAIKRWIQDRIAAIRAALIRVGFLPKEITAADLNALAGYGLKSNVSHTNKESPVLASKAPKLSKGNNAWEGLKDSEVTEYLENHLGKIASTAKAQSFGLLTLRQIADVTSKVLPEIKNTFIKNVHAMQTEKNKRLSDAGVIATKWADLPKEISLEMSDLMHDSTIAGVDGSKDYKPVIDIETADSKIKVIRQKMRDRSGEDKAKMLRDIDEIKMKVAFEKKRKLAYPGLKRRFTALARKSSDAAKIYNESRDYHEKHFTDTLEALTDRIGQSQASPTVKKNLMAQLRAKFESLQAEAPYFPLARFGDFWVHTKDGDETYFNMFESESEQKNFIEKMQNQGVDILGDGKQLKNLHQIDGVSAEFITEVDNLISQLGDVPMVNDLRDNVYQLYLHSLPDVSARKHFIHRKKTKGFHHDQLRAFAKKALHDANNIAKLIYGHKLQATLDESKEVIDIASSKVKREAVNLDIDHIQEYFRLGLSMAEIKARMRSTEDEIEHGMLLKFRKWKENYSDDALEKLMSHKQNLLSLADNIKQDDKVFAVNSLNELRQSYADMMSPKLSPISQMLNSLGFAWYLGLTPAAAIVNVTQTPVVSLPMLAAKVGWGNASKHMGDVTKLFFSNLKGGKKNGLPWVNGLTLSDSLTGLEKEAFQEWIDSGLIDVTLAHDLAGLSDEGVLTNTFKHKLMNVLSFGFHHAERMNREITALASYRSAIEKGMTHNNAVQFAADIVWDSHFDYSSANRARFMRGNVARVITQFKQYSQNLTYLYGRTFQQAFSDGVTAEERTEARRALKGLLIMQMSAAGALGLPVVGVMMESAQVLKDIFGDDDEPEDIEGLFRQTLADVVSSITGSEEAGNKFSLIFSKGVVDGLTPYSVSGRLSASDLWIRSPNRELEGSDQAWQWAKTLLGPMSGLLLENPAIALSMAQDGHYERALEQVMPKSIKDAMKSIRYTTQGVENLRGDKLTDDYSIAEGIGQILGFSSSQIAEIYDQNSAVKRLETKLNKRRQSLLTAAALARMERDNQAYSTAMKEIREFNKKNPKQRITLANISQSIKTRRRRTGDTENGLYVSKRNNELKDRYRFADN